MNQRNKFAAGRQSLLAVAFGLGLAGWAGGQDLMKTVDPGTAESAAGSLEALTVTGGSEQIWELPGSAAYVDAETIRSRGYTNIDRVAARVPGVYIRDEDGYGNFPNISLRGVDGSRSTRVTIMEDGILTAPSPYASPNAYYFPRVGRMAGVEFLKGSSQVRYGPQTTGGVVNFLSTPVPEAGGPNFFSRTTYGSDNTFFNHTWYGDVVETEAGRLGYLLEFHGQTTDGYRDIDNTSRDAGFDVLEPMLKVFFEPNTALKQRFEFKVGFTDFDANESYVGLTDEDLRANEDRRYSSTEFDRITSEQLRTYAKWIAEPTSDVRLESAIYYNSFERRWNKLNAVVAGQGQLSGTNVAAGLLDPVALAILRGQTIGGRVEYQDAFRDHEAYGWQNQANIGFATGDFEHDLAVGLRVHYDRLDGDTRRPIFEAGADGRFTEVVAGTAAPITSQEALATAIYVEDSISIGALTLRPGVRYEWLELDSGSTSLDEHLIAGGLGANYDLNEENALFGGVYRGTAAPNPNGYATGADSEESLSVELGFRHRQQGLRAEVVGFYTDFDSLLAPQLFGGGGTPDQNVGEAESMGLEAIVEYDAAERAGLGFGLPVYVSATYTNAEFTNGEPIGGSLFAGGVDGNDIPYIPEWRLAAGIGYLAQNWGVNLDLTYVSTSWGTGYNDDPRAGSPTTLDGKTDALLIFDLTGHYDLNENFRFVGGIQNLFDERGIISRAPLGPRANAPRVYFTGVEATF